MPRVEALVGRRAELDRLGEAVAQAGRRRGSVWLVAGEPGIGKSRLAEEVARGAEAQGAEVLFGRCWEGGGAPSFWPFLQVLRAIVRRGEDARATVTSGGRGRYLAAIVPELAAEVDARRAGASLGPEQARFQLLDAIVSALCDAAEATPLVVILEDMHAADASSIDVLELLAGQIGAARLAVIATARSVEPLARIERAARTLVLERLGRDDVAALLETAAGASVPPATVDALHRWTEGHPLFLTESAQWLIAHGELDRVGDRRGPVLPATVALTIDRRLADLGPVARDVAALASVLGRETTADVLRDLWEDQSGGGLDAALREASNAAVLVATPAGQLRFTHILVQEALYRSLDTGKQQAFHARAARTLEARGDAPAVIAHHYARAGATHRAEAARAYVHAAAHAVTHLSFDEAVVAYEEALALEAEEGPNAGRAERLLALAHAATLAGNPIKCREACEEAARLARAEGDAGLLARAALARGAAFTFGHVDPGLVAALEEARAQLGDRDHPLAARVLARLAAAMQPAPDPEGPIAMARSAIAMARRVGDDRTLLDALRSGCSAMMDLGDPHERRALNVEHVDLAIRLGEPAEALRGHMRTVFDAYEVGDDEAAAASVDACERLAAELDHPVYRWRAAALAAARAMREGRFEAAERLGEDALHHSRAARDPNAAIALCIQHAALLRVQGRHAEVRTQLEELGRVLAGVTLGPTLVDFIAAGDLARMGALDEARTHLDRADVELALQIKDLSVIQGLVEAASRVGDSRVADRAYEALRPLSDRFVSHGLMGMAVEGPATRLLALAAAASGRELEADRLFTEAAAAARRSRCRPWLVWTWIDHAAFLQRADQSSERSRIMLGEARVLARQLGMPGALEAIDGLDPAILAPAATAALEAGPSLRMSRDDATWLVEWRGRPLQVEDARGMHMLAMLVDAPGREVHSLDLSGRPGEGEIRDAGDAGELLDAHARADYRRRVVELRAELEEAEAWSDPARAERTRAELSFLEAELSRAIGLGGRARRDKSDAERARVNAQRRIQGAIRRLAARDAELGVHLDDAVRTGMFCCYTPPPRAY